VKKHHIFVNQLLTFDELSGAFGAPFFGGHGLRLFVFQERSQEANHALQGLGEAAGGLLQG
jgi:hypothetical protein